MKLDKAESEIKKKLNSANLYPMYKPVYPIYKPVYPIYKPVYQIYNPVYPIYKPVYPIYKPVEHLTKSLLLSWLLYICTVYIVHGKEGKNYTAKSDQ